MPIPSTSVRRLPLRVLCASAFAAAPLAAQQGIFVEPYGARVLANPRVTLRDQSLRGVEGGVILGRLEVGGHWAQATSADFRTVRPAQLVGGTMRLALPDVFVRPYLVAGASRLSFDDGFTPVGPPPRNRWIGELGAGVLVPLYGGLQLDLGVRDLVLRADSAAGPGDTTRILTHSIQLRAGLRLQLGGRRPARRPAPTVIVDQRPVRAAAPAPAPAAAPAQTPTRVVVPAAAAPAAPAPGPVVLVRTGPGEREPAPAYVVVPPAATGPGQVSFPAPTVGEVTIRYGAAPARTERAGPERGDGLVAGLDAPVADSVVARLRAELDRALANLLRPPAGTGPQRGTAHPSALQRFADSVRMHDVGQALQRYVDAYGTQRTRRVADSMVAALAVERGERHRLEARIDSLVALRTLEDATIAARRAADSVEALRRDLVPRDPVIVSSGVSFGVGTEAVIGARLDAGTPVRRLRDLHLIAEVGVGAGTLGTSTSISGLAQYRLPSVAGVHAFTEAGIALLNLTTPRAGLGRGLSLVPDIGVGAYLPVGPRDAQGRGRLIVLVRGINPSRVTRLLVGWSLR